MVTESHDTRQHLEPDEQLARERLPQLELMGEGVEMDREQDAEKGVNGFEEALIEVMVYGKAGAK